MKNNDRQKSLDKKKWLASEQSGEDMSGKLNYCKQCEYIGTSITTGKPSCFANQREREANCLCAKAYNRMIKRGAK